MILKSDKATNTKYNSKRFIKWFIYLITGETPIQTNLISGCSPFVASTASSDWYT